MKRPAPCLIVAVVGLVLAAACGGDDDAASSPGASAGAGILSGVCPDPVVVQTDWNPEAEHGALYQIAADGGDIDTENKIYTARLLSGTEETGIDIEIRVGGPAVGAQQVSSQMYTDDSILLGYVGTSEAISFSATQPTVGIVAPLEKSPQILMFDPTRYHFATFADIGASGAKVLYFEGATYMDYLIAKGDIDADQVDGSYNGSPATFVASDGAVVQQGFATAEPYIYAKEIRDWMKPVDYLLVHDSGFENYAQAVAARPEDVEANAACFEKLVPVIQQAQVDYVTDPARANALILELVEAYDTGWVYSEGVAAFSAKAQVDEGLVSNGPDAILGNFDMDRISELIEILRPVYAERGRELKAGLTAADVAVNDFIDPTIGL